MMAMTHFAPTTPSSVDNYDVFPFLAPGALIGRSEEAGLRHDKKLLYVLMNLQHWVSAAADAMVKSYEPEKTRAIHSGGCDALELASRPYVLGR